MRARIRKYLPRDDYLRLIFAVVLTAALMTAAPAIGHGVEHALFAHDAGKVDGRSAVGPGANAERRAGNLVATDQEGTFPGGAIPVGVVAEMFETGPLPESTTFESTGGQHLVLASGSAYRPTSATGPGPIGVKVTMARQGGGGFVGLAVSVLANEKNSHKALVPVMSTHTLPAGTYDLTLAEYDDDGCGTGEETSFHFCTTTDLNDRFRVVIMKLP